MNRKYENNSDSLMEEWLEKRNEYIKRPKDRTAEEVEKCLKEIELWTRPKPRYKKKKKKKADNWSGGGKYYTFSDSYKQQCIIKCNYEPDSLKKHKAFLMNYLPQKNKDEVKDKPKLFNDIEDVVSEKTIMDYETKFMDKFFFRMIISPKRQDVPLKTLVREFIKTVEKMTGYKLYWFAAEHHDTLQKHGHLLINGIDKNGKEVHFDKFYFRSGFREILRDHCTEMLGFRTRSEIQQDKEEHLRYDWWTRLDQEIKNTSYELIACTDGYPFSVTAQNSNMQVRLCYLVKKGLGKKVGSGEYPGHFLLVKDWEDRLREVSKYRSYENFKNDYFLKENVDVQLYDNKESKPISGRVIKVIRQDFEYEKDNAVVIEDSSHKIWYVHLAKEPPEYLQPGSIISFGVKKTSRAPVSPQKSTNLQTPVSPQPSVAPKKSITPQTPAKSQSSSKTKSKTKSDPEPGWSR